MKKRDNPWRRKREAAEWGLRDKVYRRALLTAAARGEQFDAQPFRTRLNLQKALRLREADWERRQSRIPFAIELERALRYYDQDMVDRRRDEELDKTLTRLEKEYYAKKQKARERQVSAYKWAKEQGRLGRSRSSKWAAARPRKLSTSASAPPDPIFEKGRRIGRDADGNLYMRNSVLGPGDMSDFEDESSHLHGSFMMEGGEE